jgi:AbiV family abortive infection protein
MSNKREKWPKPGSLLFENLFSKNLGDESFELIAAGISASSHNAERLLSDVRYLVEAGRLSSARFLLTTAREEIAKSYILADTCRVDLRKHSSVLRGLCRAFYDHISKHAYLEVLHHPNIHSMSDAKAIWEIEVKRWWPSGYESGEPDMPHDTYFSRELPLYIDYIDYDQSWVLPADSDQNYYFIKSFGESPISETEKILESWRTAASMGLCSRIDLALLNSVFKKSYIREDATREQLADLYQQAGERIMAETGISKELFMASPLVEWPLYHLVSECK